MVVRELAGVCLTRGIKTQFLFPADDNEGEFIRVQPRMKPRRQLSEVERPFSWEVVRCLNTSILGPISYASVRSPTHRTLTDPPPAKSWRRMGDCKAESLRRRTVSPSLRGATDNWTLAVEMPQARCEYIKLLWKSFFAPQGPYHRPWTGVVTIWDLYGACYFSVRTIFL